MYDFMFGVWHLLFVASALTSVGPARSLTCMQRDAPALQDVSLEARTAWSEAGVERGVSQ